MKKRISQEKIDAKLASFTSYTEDDFEEVMSNEKRIEKILSSNDSLKKFCDDGKCFFSMIKDSCTRKYKLPYKTLAGIIGTLLYVLLPFDMIPDFIPVVGYVDDASILGACLACFKSDIDEYKNFKATQVDKKQDVSVVSNDINEVLKNRPEEG